MKMSRAILVVGTGVLAIWLAVAVGSGRSRPSPVAPPAPPATSPLDPLIANIEAQSGRLRAYHDRAQALPPASRDPFHFAQQAPRAAAFAAARPAISTSAVSLAPPRPVLTLSGVAEDTIAGAAVRTAIITDARELYLVKEGEEFGGRFRVVRISSDAVEVRDLSDGASLTLILRD